MTVQSFVVRAQYSNSDKTALVLLEGPAEYNCPSLGEKTNPFNPKGVEIFNYAVNNCVVADYVEPEVVKTSTVVEFLDKFTDLELNAIFTAKKTDVLIDLMITRVTSATTVYYNDQKLLDGLNYLVSQSLLTNERKLEIIG